MPGFQQRVVIAAAVAVLLSASWAMRPDPLEAAKVQTALIHEDQTRAHEAWKAIRRASGATWELPEAERVEREVLVPWRAARRRVEAVMSGPDARYFPPELDEFFRLREESWTALVEAVRTDDEELFRRHAELFEKAEAVGQKVVEFKMPTGVPVLGR